MLTSSVALCTYNGGEFLSEQLLSIINQSVSVNEIIICDDKSTDNTIEIIKKFQKEHPNLITLFINATQLGSSKNFYKAIKRCTKDIIFLCDQDDIWKHNKVEVFLKEFKLKPYINLVASNGHLLFDNGIREDIVTVWDTYSYYQKDYNMQDFNFFKLITSIGNIVTGAASAIRKTLAESIPEFFKSANIHHDELLALLASSNNNMSFINEKLFYYRIHSNQQVGIEFFTEKNDMDYLLKPFHNAKTFKSYKRLIKKNIIRYQHYDKILSEISKNSPYYEIIELAKQTCELQYQKNKKNLQKVSPYKYTILSIIDAITGKRKLH